MIEIKDVNALRFEILKSGYSFASFSREIGISRSNLNKIFTRQKISAPVAKKIGVALKRNFDEIFKVTIRED